MNDKLKIALIAALTALVVAVVVVRVGKPAPVARTIEKTIREVVGAIPGNELQGSEWIVGGATIIRAKMGMAASNTPCALQARATSTVDRVTVVHTGQFSATSNDNATWQMGTSTIRTATGSVFYGQDTPEPRGLSVSVRPSLAGTAGAVGSTTQGIVLRPNDWVNVNVASPSFASTEVVGTCVIELLQMAP